jgi:hypothetical protein
MSWVDFLVPFGTAGGGAASVYGLVVRPRQQEHLRHEAARKTEAAELLERRRQRDITIDGDVGIPGVRPPVIAMAVRLEKVEGKMGEVVATVGALGDWQKEANGTAKRTADAVLDIRGILNNLVETGVTSRIKVGKDASDVAILTAESQTALLDAIHQHHEGENLTSG